MGTVKFSGFGQAEVSIRKAMATMVTKLLKSKERKVEAAVRRVIRNGIVSSAAWKSLQGEDQEESLRSHLGLRKNQVRGWLRSILNTWLDSVKVETRPASVSFARPGGYMIRAIKADFSDVLNLPAAQYDSDGEKIPWLRWLLLENDEVIIKDYEILFGPAEKLKNSRSGFSIMRPNPDAEWKLPTKWRTGQSFIDEMIENPRFQSLLTKAIIREITRA